jgi:hypothetical protein
MLVRSVALGNLNPAVMGPAVALANQAGGLQEVLDPPPAAALAKAHLAADGCEGHVVFLVYDTVSPRRWGIS